MDFYARFSEKPDHPFVDRVEFVKYDNEEVFATVDVAHYDGLCSNFSDLSKADTLVEDGQLATSKGEYFFV